MDGEIHTLIRIPPGLYTLKGLIQVINNLIPQIKLSLLVNGIITLTQEQNPRGAEIASTSFDEKLVEILGFNKRAIFEEIYVGRQPARLSTHILFYIYLDQISTSSNLVDGIPSTLLAVVPASTSEGSAICIKSEIFIN